MNAKFSGGSRGARTLSDVDPTGNTLTAAVHVLWSTLVFLRLTSSIASRVILKALIVRPLVQLSRTISSSLAIALIMLAVC